MILSLVFSSVAGDLCLKIWTRHHSSQRHLNENLPPGITAVIQYHDVKATSIFLFVANELVTVTASDIPVLILQDIYNFLPKFVLRWFTLPKQPLSSITLPQQALLQVVSTICIIVATCMHTVVVFFRSATVVVHQGDMQLPASTIQPMIDHLGILLPYSDVKHIRITAILAWPATFFAIAANVVTIIAWLKYRRANAVDSGVIDSVEVEMSSDDKKATA